MICEYLQQNEKIIDGLDTRMVLQMQDKNYISKMQKNSTWGGAIEIQAACNIWKLRIMVNTSKGKIEFLPINNTYKKTINIYWSGNHFKAIEE